MAEEFKIRVLTPVGVALEDSAKSATLPTVDGEIGILPHHTRYSGIVGEGTLRYEKASGGSESIDVTGGFVNFSGDTLTILADRAGL